jgi:DNA repair photolyase
MDYKEIKVEYLLNKITKKDNLFNGDYTVDPYRNCEFGCMYCDSSFDKAIYIKKNAVEIFEKELKKSKNGTIIVGSVNDPYQKIEEKYKITREILEIIKKYDYSCHILTKSDLVLRDADILKKIKNCRVTISIISLKKSICQIFEKNVISPDIRLNTIKNLKEKNIKSGLAILPILPYITDEEIKIIIKKAKKYYVDYLVYKHLELKGDQKGLFFKIIKEFYPELLEKYTILYKDSFSPNKVYISKIENILKNKKII